MHITAQLTYSFLKSNSIYSKWASISTKNLYSPFSNPLWTDSQPGQANVNFGEFILIFFSLSIHTYLPL